MKNTDISESNLRTKWLGIYKPYPKKKFFLKILSIFILDILWERMIKMAHIFASDHFKRSDQNQQLKL